MALPGVNINIQQGEVGASPVNDGIMGMILAGPGATTIGPKLITNFEKIFEAEIDGGFGLTKDQDLDAIDQIKAFYTTAPIGTQLFVTLVDPATKMSDALQSSNPEPEEENAAPQKDNSAIANLLSFAEGAIKMWGISLTAGNAVDEINSAVTLAHDVCEKAALIHRPCRALIGAFGFSSDVQSLPSFKNSDKNRVGAVLGAANTNGYPALGLTLGQFANRPVQRKISRVKDGSLPLDKAYLSDGKPVEDYRSAFQAIHEKNYIFFRTYQEKSGYFYNSDVACTEQNDVFGFLAMGRVIDKAHRIAYATFINEIEDDLDVDTNGFLSPVVVKGYQQKITSALEVAMAGEVSGVEAFVDGAQNILQSNKVSVNIFIRPKGYSSEIQVNLGFLAAAN